MKYTISFIAFAMTLVPTSPSFALESYEIRKTILARDYNQCIQIEAQVLIDDRASVSEAVKVAGLRCRAKLLQLVDLITQNDTQEIRRLAIEDAIDDEKDFIEKIVQNALRYKRQTKT